jgi:hypothetical protein
MHEFDCQSAQCELDGKIVRGSYVVRFAHISEAVGYTRYVVHSECVEQAFIGLYDEDAEYKAAQRAMKRKPAGKRGRPSLGFSDAQKTARHNWTVNTSSAIKNITSNLVLRRWKLARDIWNRQATVWATMEEIDFGVPLPNLRFDEEFVQLIRERDYDFGWYVFYGPSRCVELDDRGYLLGDPRVSGARILGALAIMGEEWHEGSAENPQ